MVFPCADKADIGAVLIAWGAHERVLLVDTRWKPVVIDTQLGKLLLVAAVRCPDFRALEKPVGTQHDFTVGQTPVTVKDAPQQLECPQLSIALTCPPWIVLFDILAAIHTCA